MLLTSTQVLTVWSAKGWYCILKSTKTSTENWSLNRLVLGIGKYLKKIKYPYLVL